MNRDLGDRSGARDFVTVTIGAQLFGLPIESVHDVFLVEALTRVPLARPEIAGVLNLRGRIVTAIDMRRRLALEGRDAEGKRLAVGIERQGEAFGLIVDEVGDVLRLGQDAREPNPPNLDRRWAEVADGVCRLERDLMIVLDVDRVLALGSEAGHRERGEAA